MEKKGLPIGKDDFKKLIEEDCYYVDKTGVIEELLTNKADVTLFPRPRRFGKSLLMSMLNNFFDIDYRETNKDLFRGLYIENSKYYSELNSYPTIYLDFKELKQDTYEDFYDNFKKLISKLYKSKKYIQEILEFSSDKEYFDKMVNNNGTHSDYQSAVVNMAEWLEKYYHKKVIILIDEYDAPLSNAYVKGIYDEEMKLLRSVFSSSLKNNTSLKFGVLTGVLRVSGESLLSDLNNLKIYDIMSSNYNEFFGFTERETKELLEYYGLKLTDEVRSYYDGYNMGGLSIYNPWSILNYAEDRKLIAYWFNTSSNSVLKKSLKSLKEDDKIELEKLIINESISFKYNQKLTYKDLDELGNFENTLNLLLSTGYLTFDYEEKLSNMETVNYFRIPNLEVKKEMIDIIKDINEFKSTNELYYALIDNDKGMVERLLTKSLEGASYHDTKELFYHGYLLGIFSGFINSEFVVKSNRESGLGRPDIIIEKKDYSLGIIVEIKIAKNRGEMEQLAEVALKQIKCKEYYQDLKLDKVKTIYEYAIVFYGKECIVR